MSSTTDKEGVIRTELDLLLTPEQYNSLYDQGEKRQKRKAYRPTQLWPNGKVAYIFDHRFSSHQQHNIRKAMAYIERYTCVSFHRRTNEKNYLAIRNENDCSSYFGMVGSQQPLYLVHPSCEYMGIYIHEFLHALGLVHEQSRPDRDNFVDIFRENVHPHLLHNFKKYSTAAVDTMGTEYDFASIMHYGTRLFSMNGKNTLYPKDPSKAKLIRTSKNTEIGYTDVELVNKMYKCASHCPDQNKCTKEGHLDQNCNCICKDGSQDCDTSKTPVLGSSCTNLYKNESACYTWALRGECSRNPKFMHPKCARACGVCQETAPPPCVNRYYDPSECSRLARSGECSINPAWMLYHCAKSCGMCTKTSHCPDKYKCTEEGYLDQNCNCICKDGNQGCETSKTPLHDSSCTNTYSNESACYNWALWGHCSLNPTFMLQNCAKACGQCKNTASCAIEHSDQSACSRWARSGDCTRIPGWMLQHCAKACGMCRNSESCINKYSSQSACDNWARLGECSRNTNWMLQNCAKSCGMCEIKSLCTNKHSQCNQWASLGECNRIPKTMFPKCPRACGLCPDTVSCTNKHYHPWECFQWANEGRCSKDPGWMFRNCAKACKLCSKDDPLEGECRDVYKEDRCRRWKDLGECNSSPEFMKNSCRKTCNLC